MAAVDRAEREGRTFSVRLAPLDAETAAALLGADLPAATRELLFLESGGNPFYLEHLARSARSARRGGRGRARGRCPASRAPWPRRWREELRRVAGDDPDRARRRRGDRRRLRPRDRRRRGRGGTRRSPSTRSTSSWTPTSCARRSTRAASPSATRSSGARSTTRPAPAGGCSRTSARPPACAHAVPRPRRWRTTWPSSARAGDEDAIGRPARRRPPRCTSRRRPRRRAGSPRARADALRADGAPPRVDARELAAAQAAAGQVAHARTTLLARARPVPLRRRRRACAVDRALPSAWTGCSAATTTATSGCSGRWRRCRRTPTDEQALLYVALAVDAFHRAELADMVAWGERAIAAGRARSARAVTAAGLAVVAFAAALTGDTARARELCDEAAAALRAARRRGARELPRGGAVPRPARDVHRALRRRGRPRAAAASTRRARPATPRWSRCSPSRSATRRAMLGRLDEARAVLEGAVEQERLVDSRFAVGLGAA